MGHPHPTHRYSLADPSVTPSVADMSYQRLPYDDAATPTEMVSDCAQVGLSLHMPVQRYDDLATDRPATPAFGRIVVTDELAERAAGLELHFD